MPRPPNPVRPYELCLSIPEDLHTTVSVFLYSELEGCVPRGAYSRFYQERIREFFAHESLDLAPWAATDPGACIVRGSPETIEILKKTLKGDLPR